MRKRRQGNECGTCTGSAARGLCCRVNGHRRSAYYVVKTTGDSLRIAWHWPVVLAWRPGWFGARAVDSPGGELGDDASSTTAVLPQFPRTEASERRHSASSKRRRNAELRPGQPINIAPAVL